MQDVMQPINSELEQMLSAREQHLTLVKPVEDIAVAGDATLLRLLVRNLVENAHRYSPEGSTITVRIESPDAPVLAVEDEGPGIDESRSGELSKAFVRMDSRYGGAGLGLSIVTRIAQLHDAQFFLHNRLAQTGVRAWVKFHPTARQA